MMAFEDSTNEGNSPKYHTGKKCIESGCSKPAGTYWGKFWCFEHNVERIHRIDKELSDIISRKPVIVDGGKRAREALEGE